MTKLRTIEREIAKTSIPKKPKKKPQAQYFFRVIWLSILKG